jgi:hypothetical protein
MRIMNYEFSNGQIEEILQKFMNYGLPANAKTACLETAVGNSVKIAIALRLKLRPTPRLFTGFRYSQECLLKKCESELLRRLIGYCPPENS